MGNECCMQELASEYEETEKSVERLSKRSQLETKNFALLEDEDTKRYTETWHGRGVEEQEIVLPDGSKYVGEVKEGLPEGHGVETHGDGDSYHGGFKKGVKEGLGEYRFQDGRVYTGQFRNGRIEGRGKLLWENGDWYEGEFQNNSMHGLGKYHSFGKGAEYEGEYKDGLKHGEGTVRYRNYELKGTWCEGYLQSY